MVEIKIIGVWRKKSDDLELRLVRDQYGTWQADLVVDLTDNTVRKPPACFTPSIVLTEALDRELEEFVANFRPPARVNVTVIDSDGARHGVLTEDAYGDVINLDPHSRRVD